MKLFVAALAFFISISTFGQKRLELLETNIPEAGLAKYTDSYLWTKNWWLVNRKMVETSKGGNALSADSKLTKVQVDSLSQVFSRYLPTDIAHHGHFTPRVSFNGTKKLRPYIKSSIYEIHDSSVKLICQFIIEFGTKNHNSMPDIFGIMILDPKDVTPYSAADISKWYHRKPTKLETDIMGPSMGE